MKRFVQLFQAVDATTSTNEKVRALRDYFTEVAPADAAWALYLLLGKPRRRLVTSRVLRQTYLTISGLPDWLFRDCYAHVGDAAEVIALLLQTTSLDRQPQAAKPLHHWLETIIPQVNAVDTEADRQALIVSWWSALAPFEVFVLNKILTGAFRFGASSKLVIRGLSQACKVPEAVLAHRLMGDFEPTVAFFQQLTSTAATEHPPSQPYPFFLAAPLEVDRFQQDQGNRLDHWLVEWKWDGIRAQVIKRADQVFIWSRGEDLVTPQFPELVEAFQPFPNGSVLDGEILCWREDRPLSFNHLQKRLGRKRVTQKLMADSPVHFVAYDLLEAAGNDMRPHPLCDRKQTLATLLNSQPDTAPIHLSQALAPDDFQTLQSLRQQARDHGAEGLVLKALDSPYLVGRKRGYWWKYKVDPMTLDAVLIYAQAGSGKRANLFTDYTFALWHGDELVPFAKAYSGLNNAEIERLDKWIRRHTQDRFGPVRAVEPTHVFEIAFEGIAKSKRHKSGISVRFPRILRWRRDKPISEADTVQAAHTLWHQYGG
ncbi:ATP-dependent DNA ligase [Halomicronema hongdechloris C2206]|uniref:DNA ligase (ATP) n=1 Tax=Halomicronema hongdechloris C2206 TaxID=1641165 RepID=A0A1Z3HSL0_9CYAN|nr:ATP-dependent DNA ligase [Halomicronema hongdechloris]ASC73301.1 ATP-dependent DNA ligase [Halomicronema hongdechloris C2206]